MTEDTDTVTRTRRLVRWLKDKIEKRRDERDDHDPWWVTLMLDLGRPAVAVMILIMCAPGEHYLGVMAGWTRGMAWLTPAALTAYAGISAVVATKRPKGAPGRKTAVCGAVLSILIAMAAQPLAHLYEQHLITGYRPALTIVVSCIPAAVFGHLLHMGAAAPKVRRTAKPKADKRKDVRPDTPPPAWVTEEKARRTVAASRSDIVTDAEPDAMTWTPDTPADTEPDTPRTPDIGKGSVSADVRQYLTDHPDATNDDLYAAMRLSWPDKPDNTFYTARLRYEKKIGKVS
jgi:hypothetical protein